jgi:hypothetical protein
MIDRTELAIRTLEIEAEMLEEQAVRFSTLALNMEDSPHKTKVQELAREALEQAAAIRQHILEIGDDRHKAS